jgi:transposase
MPTIGDPKRFQKSRLVGCFLGMRPRKQDSGENRPQLEITKAGYVYLRKTLVNRAHHILGPRGGTPIWNSSSPGADEQGSPACAPGVGLVCPKAPGPPLTKQA